MSHPRAAKATASRGQIATTPMTTVQITLPDALAQEAASAGLLAPEKIERLLRERLRIERVARMQEVRAVLAAKPLALMTPQEISIEIEAYRVEQRRAAGSRHQHGHFGAAVGRRPGATDRCGCKQAHRDRQQRGTADRASGRRLALEVRQAAGPARFRRWRCVRRLRGAGGDRHAGPHHADHFPRSSRRSGARRGAGRAGRAGRPHRLGRCSSARLLVCSTSRPSMPSRSSRLLAPWRVSPRPDRSTRLSSVENDSCGSVDALFASGRC